MEFYGNQAICFAASMALIAIITADVPGTAMVAFSVALIMVYFLATLYFWGENLNMILNTFVNLAFSVCIDFSQHIVQQFLNVVPPKSCKTNFEKRMYKAKQAISEIGSSVVHCGASTFFTILPLTAASSYVFKLYFKVWFCIIFYGLANGFLLMPVLLCYFGPLTEYGGADSDEEDNFEKTKVIKITD